MGSLEYMNCLSCYLGIHDEWVASMHLLLHPGRSDWACSDIREVRVHVSVPAAVYCMHIYPETTVVTLQNLAGIMFKSHQASISLPPH
jgi:hypothetical protein